MSAECVHVGDWSSREMIGAHVNLTWAVCGGKWIPLLREVENKCDVIVQSLTFAYERRPKYEKNQKHFLLSNGYVIKHSVFCKDHKNWDPKNQGI